ncbi:TPA: hypothetical protein K4452_002536 [Enterococcus faecalis]|uniref:hypothetical protein n=1 Tax=Enterococcus faecalis TaxID=1351 RepID=UPI001CB21A13|nr:hypothetical protein [Enterococcus faecalis]
MSLNLGGVFNICRAIFLYLEKNNTIVVIALADLGIRSILERIGYCSSKATVVMLTKCYC